MNAFFTAVKRSPKLVAMTAALAGVVVVPAALMAWGPSRTTYTMAHPADHVVFNSITDNPDQGDERNFVNIRQAGVGTYGDNIQLQAGKEYEVSVFYHNNAASIYNDAAHNYSGIAKDTMMRIQMPGSVKAGEKARVTGLISASNANPQQVWDEAYGAASQDMDLRYVQGSARVYSKGAVNGQTMPNSLFTSGAALGYDSLNGKVPGCNEFEGWVVFKFKAVAPDFTVEKTVEKVGTNSFAKSITVNPGEDIEYKIKYVNTGSTTQESVVVKDKLPAGVTYVPGTTNLANAGTNGQWKKLSDDKVVSTGINIGSYAPGAKAYVSFKAKVAGKDKLKCGTNTLVNTATVETDNGSKSDTATVIVTKKCKNMPPELPHTGISSGMLSAIGLGVLTAGLAYAVRSDRIRNLLKG